MIRLAAIVLTLLIAAPALGQGVTNSLTNPAALNAQAPAVYKVQFDTSKGTFVIEVHRDWAPHGADRFYNLVKNGFYDGARFFRVISGFMVQFGINGNPSISAQWRDANIPDDRVTQSNQPGYITFATRGPNTTLADLLTPLFVANPFSTMRATLLWWARDKVEDGLAHGWQGWLRRRAVDSFFSVLLF